MTDLIKNIEPDGLVREIRTLIDESRSLVAVSVNSALTMLYWNIGRLINEEILNGERAQYGKQIVATVSQQLNEEYGKGFAEKNLRRMMQFSTVFPAEEIVVSLIRQLSWTHIIALIPLYKPHQREFYAEMCRMEKWSVRTLRNRIDSMLYERTALSRKPDELIEQELVQLREKDHLTPNLILKDPYILDFLELNDHYFEKDLEDAILRELEQFLLELGAGFTFVARQKRIQIDDEDFYIDLLLYNRKLKCLMVIDLKQGAFKAAYKGQMELYLRWLAKHEQEAGENPPMGLILCSGKRDEQIELLQLDQSGIHVADYLTELPEKALLQKKLHEAVAKSRLRLDNRPEPE